MIPPRRYSVSPLPSFCTTTQPVPALRESLWSIWQWVTGRQPKPSERERQLEAAVITRLAQEIAEQDAGLGEQE